MNAPGAICKPFQYPGRHRVHKLMLRSSFATVLFAATLLAQAPTIQEGRFQGRRAWIMANGLIQVSVLAGGGHIAEVRLLSSDPKASINPMRVPHYPTIDPHEYDPAKHDAIYGDDSGRWLMSGYMGHMLCFPR
jgi:hypothetical protein